MTHYRMNSLETIITAEAWLSKDTSDRSCVRRDEIARLAYQFYEARGRRGGSDLDDLLLAEAEFRNKVTDKE